MDATASRPPDLRYSKLHFILKFAMLCQVKEMKVKVVDFIFCMFKGHHYGRFERRNPTCIHCDSVKKSNNLHEGINRNASNDVGSYMHKYNANALQNKQLKISRIGEILMLGVRLSIFISTSKV